MSFDPVTHREESLHGWEAAASGWVRRQDQIRDWAAPVAQWMVQSADPQPGEQVLELAAGLGETGLLAAELVAPVGRAIISDQAEAMLDGARRRAAELGISNVEFKVLNAEWIDLPLASLDIVLCRWGYMLMADPLAALGESRRVLRPGGRLALAIWDTIQANPWALLPALELSERGSGAGRPGPARRRSPVTRAARARSRWAIRRSSGACSSRPASPRSRSTRSTSCSASRISRPSGSPSWTSRGPSTTP